MRETGALLMVMDWGIGGLPLFQSLRSAFPEAPLLYLSDSGSVPYGRQSPGELAARLQDIAAFASRRGIRTVAVACNAMSSILPAPVSLSGGVELLSLIHFFLASPLPAGLRAGIIGGIRTIQSGIYQKALEDAGNSVSACPAQELSALIEAGDFDGVPPVLEKTFARLGGIDLLVLACTHYPAVSPIIQKMFSSVNILDPGRPLLDECLRRLSAFREGGLSGGARNIYITTGDAGLARRSPEKAFGFAGLPFERIRADLSC
ncbi:MAG: aspartate/glutamate racemase family protein [Spirochaetaceae bacterium]|jgi:glutamate racemase|nr:aspartate/glutamate racemase family protein [Spirochaetaceae bacterium]